MRTLPIVRRIEVQLIVCLCVFCCPNLRAQTSVWTWHNDNGRTGQNASETSLTPTTVVKTSFGQVCHYAVDGQVYAQPLVLANATVLGTHRSSVVYVVTQNDSVYLLDGTNCGFIASAITGTSTSLIPSGETAVSCSNIGSTRCKTIAPTVGILGTPVIDENTNHIYVVTYSQSGSNYYHRLHALFTGLVSGTTPLAEDPAYNSSPNGVIISSGSTFSPQFISQTHIQRPGVLLLPDTQAARPQIYIGFSMMDGLPSFPPGFIFRYYGDDLSQTPLVYTSEPTRGLAHPSTKPTEAAPPSAN